MEIYQGTLNKKNQDAKHVLGNSQYSQEHKTTKEWKNQTDKMDKNLCIKSLWGDTQMVSNLWYSATKEHPLHRHAATQCNH